MEKKPGSARRLTCSDILGLYYHLLARLHWTTFQIERSYSDLASEGAANYRAELKCERDALQEVMAWMIPVRDKAAEREPQWRAELDFEANLFAYCSRRKEEGEAAWKRLKAEEWRQRHCVYAEMQVFESLLIDFRETLDKGSAGFHGNTRGFDHVDKILAFEFRMRDEIERAQDFERELKKGVLNLGAMVSVVRILDAKTGDLKKLNLDWPRAQA